MVLHEVYLPSNVYSLKIFRCKNILVVTHMSQKIVPFDITCIPMIKEKIFSQTNNRKS